MAGLLVGAAVGAWSAPSDLPGGSNASASTAAALNGPIAQMATSGADSVARFLQDSGVLTNSEGSGQLMQQMRGVATDLVVSAMQFLGVPYKRGGTTENGFDCSGFTRHVFENSLGLILPRRSRDQAQSPGLLPIRKEELRPGDLVFFNTMRSAFSHVGIYVGDGKFIHAPRTGSKVRVEDMREAYWTKRFNGARRAPAAAQNNAAAAAALASGGDATGPSTLRAEIAGEKLQ
ncbi:C40 family peptidase [Leptothrix discophora]|uniref:C40 family peptidase n=1 Tax=Leptothrix discophora TaxID=89 RepID=A0ABT9G1T8_LEPDI|nr:C40 family peptidase [Leptothrix discophora]MDP4300455.1 C40 family peptidase [Leptothrix discophora]